MQLYIFAALLVVEALNMADAEDRPPSECCTARKYKVPITSAPPKDPTKPWQYAVRVGPILYLSSLRAFHDLNDPKSFGTRGTYNESMKIMKFTRAILKDAGCTWNDVHDVTVLVTGNTTEYQTVDKAMYDFCEQAGCLEFPWAGHLRTTPSIDGGASVEFTVQASNCNWTDTHTATTGPTPTQLTSNSDG
ncbi:uncharacterized protein LOC129596879 [Paramacrobiotus metropolitanus]|uniref:uncharacterized protein LOC129596879 n=1 Tax=Paramacrobiotus metropolitanus TaxID=2943436 RepID=UPI0024464F43|nr:uncharacterized protein LOC129596879 [Paramacrobiotus metropolitanus]